MKEPVGENVIYLFDPDSESSDLGGIPEASLWKRSLIP